MDMVVMDVVDNWTYWKKIILILSQSKRVKDRNICFRLGSQNRFLVGHWGWDCECKSKAKRHFSAHTGKPLVRIKGTSLLIASTKLQPSHCHLMAVISPNRHRHCPNLLPNSWLGTGSTYLLDHHFHHRHTHHYTLSHPWEFGMLAHMSRNMHIY